MTILLTIYLWLMIGDLLLSLRPWEPDDYWLMVLHRVIWPTSLWWVLRRLVRDWRTDLYYRTKHL